MLAKLTSSLALALGFATTALISAPPLHGQSSNPSNSIAQEAYVKASNTDEFDGFGMSIAVSGDTMVVGARYEDSNGTGVNGGAQANNSVRWTGAAYVFRKSGGAWTQEAYLKASNSERDDWFGTAVAISGDTIAVGALGEDSHGTGANSGMQGDNSIYNAGAVYVFTRSGSTWTQQAYLKASNPGVGDAFGDSVAISGDTLVVGAQYEESAGTGVNNGAQADNSARFAGAAYVFKRSAGTWAQEAYLKPTNTDTEDRFGASLDICGDTIVVGARHESSAGTGVNSGAQHDNNGYRSGAAYVFRRIGSTWGQQAYLKASNADNQDLFGESVAIWGETLIVGAFLEASSGTGVNGGTQDNNTSAEAGAAYVFTRSGTTWSQEAYLKASNTESLDWFGSSVDISEDTAVIGAMYEKSSSTGVNGGGQANNGATRAGAAFVFTKSGATWDQAAYLKASNTTARDFFGHAVALSGDTALVAAPQENSAGTGVNGNAQADESAENAGAVYLFDLASGAIGTNYCMAASNSTGLTAALAATGSGIAADNDVTLMASSLPTGSFGYFLTSDTTGFSMNPGGSQGNLCLGASIGRYVGAGQIQNSGSAGAFALQVDLTVHPTPNGSTIVQPGQTWHFTAWFRDSVAGQSTSNFSDGLSIDFQ